MRTFTEAHRCEVIHIPITVQGLPPTAVGIAFGIAYDPEKLLLLEFIFNQTLFYYCATDSSVSAGSFGFVGTISSDYPLSGNEEVGLLEFRVCDDAACGETILSFIAANYDYYVFTETISGTVYIMPTEQT